MLFSLTRCALSPCLCPSTVHTAPKRNHQATPVLLVILCARRPALILYTFDLHRYKTANMRGEVRSIAMQLRINTS